MLRKILFSLLYLCISIVFVNFMVISLTYAYDIDDMFNEIEFLTERRQIIAENIANIDSPGYKTQDIMPLSEEDDCENMTLAVTNPQHIELENRGNAGRRYEPESSEVKFNGNNVVLEKEMVKSNEISNKLDRVSNLYNKARNMIKQVSSGK